MSTVLNNSFSKFYNKSQQNTVKTNAVQKKNTYTNTLSGLITGSAVGIIDGYITNKSRKKAITNGLEELKKYSISEKKQFIKELNNHGISVKSYKDTVKKVLNRSTGSEIIKKSLIYASIITGIGLVADLRKNRKQKTT